MKDQISSRKRLNKYSKVDLNLWLEWHHMCTCREEWFITIGVDLIKWSNEPNTTGQIKSGLFVFH